MIRITKGSQISLTRGDSAYLTLNINTGNGTPYVMNEGDVVKVQVRTAPNVGKLLIDGQIEDDAEGNLVWHIYPDETKYLDVTTYWWDAQIETANGDVFTFIPSSKFTLLDEVTMEEV